MVFCEEQPAPSELVYLDTLEGEYDFLVEEDGTRLVLESDTSQLVFEGERVVGWGALAWLHWVGCMGCFGWGCHMPGPDGSG